MLIPTALPADEHIPCARQISVMSPAVVDSTLDDGHANPSSISLKVCTDCKDALLRSFHHCLSHQGEMPELSSFYEIDEIKDAIQLKEPPYFDILRDPTAKVPPVDLESEQHKVIRDRWVFAEQKKSHKENKFFCFQAAQQRSVAGQNSKGFSGALYKRMLDHKDKEIQTLKAQLYDRHLAENHESQNVHRLKNALSKAVKYYTFAEEWQKSESGRLQKDVQFLKAELSSLMAFLINAEDEKQRVFWLI